MFAGFMTIMCNSEPREPHFRRNPLALSKNSLEVFPLQNLLKRDAIERIGEIESLVEIAEINELIFLEAKSESIIAEISQLRYWDGHWVVLDSIQGIVFQFDNVGNFVRRIGKKGEGPGEFLSPGSVEICFDGNLAIWDMMRDSVSVFNRNGVFIRDVRFMKLSQTFLPRGGVLWPRESEIYIFGFKSFFDNDPQHVRIQLSEKGETFHGFGVRREPDFVKQGTSMAWNAHGIVSSRLWVASPYESKIDIFDLSGGYISTLEVAGMDRLKMEDWAGLNKEDRRNRAELWKEKQSYTRIVPAGNLVFAWLKNKLDVYDLNGNIIKPNLKRGKIRPLLTSYGNCIVTCILPLGDTEHYELRDLEYLKSNSLWEKISEDMNPIIRVSRITF